MAYTLNGSSQYLKNASAIRSAAPMSFVCWFQTPNDADNMSLVAMCDTDDAGGTWRYSLEARGDLGNGVLAFVKSAGYSGYAASAAPYSVNTWHHAAATFPANNLRYAYIDGGDKGGDADACTPDLLELLVGVREKGGPAFNGYFDGTIAEVAVYDSTLTDDEVAILGEGYSPLFVRPASLVAYWPLIGRSSPEPDIVGGYDLTLVGSPTVADHPRIIYPSPQLYISYGEAEVGPPGQSTIWYPNAANLDFRVRERMVVLKSPYAGTQSEVEWHVCSDGACTAEVWTSGLRAPDDIDLGTDWCQIHLDAIGLTVGGRYYLQCRVRDSVDQTSEWSEAVAFDVVGIAGSVWRWSCA